MKWIIFDLDGTLADIEDRRQLCTKENGKMDWNKFFDPKNSFISCEILLEQQLIKLIIIIVKIGSISVSIFGERIKKQNNNVTDNKLVAIKNKLLFSLLIINFEEECPIL